MKSPDENARDAQKLKKNSLPTLYNARGTLTPRDRPKSCKKIFLTGISLKYIGKRNERGIDGYSIIKTSEKKRVYCIVKTAIIILPIIQRRALRRGSNFRYYED